MKDKSLKARWRVSPEPLQQSALLHGFTSLFRKIIDFNLQNVSLSVFVERSRCAGKD